MKQAQTSNHEQKTTAQNFSFKFFLCPHFLDSIKLSVVATNSTNDDWSGGQSAGELDATGEDDWETSKHNLGSVWRNHVTVWWRDQLRLFYDVTVFRRRIERVRRSSDVATRWRSVYVTSQTVECYVTAVLIWICCSVSKSRQNICLQNKLWSN